MKKHIGKMVAVLVIGVFLLNPLTALAAEAKPDVIREPECKKVEITDYFVNSHSIPEKLKYREGRYRGLLEFKSKKIISFKRKWEVVFVGEICRIDPKEGGIIGKIMARPF